MSATIISGLQKQLLLIRILGGTAFRILLKYPNIKTLFKTKREIKQLRNNYSHRSTLPKIARVNNRFFISPNLQAWPSPHFYRNFLQMAKKNDGHTMNLAEEIRLVLFAITNRCKLNCEHCYEAGNLNKGERLSLDDLKDIVKKLQGFGIPLFQLGGGEPMMRFNDLLELLKFANKNVSDFWITTSGMNMNMENAILLKNAGLTGVAISLDHFNEKKHNSFRRHPQAFKWAKDAVLNANLAGLATTLNVCVTREFCTKENLFAYAELAKKWGVAFIQILEARKAGNYAEKEVELLNKHHKIIEEFYFSLNHEKKYKDYPIAHYYSFRQRTSGCTAAGMRYLYIDTYGNINTCPFCRGNGGHILKNDLAELIQNLRNKGCLKYRLAI